MIVTRGTLGVIGAGVMGQALIKGLLAREAISPDKIWGAVKSNSSRDKLAHALGIEAITDFKPNLKDAEVILLCVKPSGMQKVLTQLKEAGLREDVLLISIVTGTTIETMESTLGGKNPVIRAMPNTPAIVGKGMSVICPGTHATAAQMQVAKNIFESVGECLELEESYLDAVTAMSGCGPAYFYLIMEALADGGVRVGLPRDVALKLVTQTAQGAAAMVQETGVHPAALRDDVTTPAGCTIAALLTMEDGKIRSVLARAVEAATRQAEDLGKSTS